MNNLSMTNSHSLLNRSSSCPPTILAANDPMSCTYKTGKCTSPRTYKRNGNLHTLCEDHRDRQNVIQRKSDRKNHAAQAERRRINMAFSPKRNASIFGSSSSTRLQVTNSSSSCGDEETLLENTNNIDMHELSKSMMCFSPTKKRKNFKKSQSEIHIVNTDPKITVLDTLLSTPPSISNALTSFDNTEEDQLFPIFKMETEIGPFSHQLPLAPPRTLFMDNEKEDDFQSIINSPQGVIDFWGKSNAIVPSPKHQWVDDDWFQHDSIDTMLYDEEEVNEEAVVEVAQWESSELDMLNDLLF